MRLKIVSACVALILLITLSSCGSDSESTQSETNVTIATAETFEETAAVDNIKTDVTVEPDELDLNADWDGELTEITLGDSVNVEGSGATESNGYITVSSKGSYRFTGTLENGGIIVDADGCDVQLILDNVSITSLSSAPIYVKQANKTVITLADGSQNTLTDSADAVYADAEAEEPNATVFSKDDLTFNGGGELTINANFNNGINCKDKLKLISGNIEVTAKNNAIKGKDYVFVSQTGLDITSFEGDGIQAYNDTDGEKGFVLIEGGKINIDSADNGIQAYTVLSVRGGTLDITSANNGLKSKYYYEQTDGDITIKSEGDGAKAESDDGTKGYILLSGGSLVITSGTDGIQASCDLTVNGGEYTITSGGGSAVSSSKADSGWGSWGEKSQSTESEETASAKGLKAGNTLSISSGEFNIDSSDDSLHANGDITIMDGNMKLLSGDDGVHSDTTLTISGGEITISKSYEGIEGGVINVSGGDVSVTSSDDGFNVSGGNDSSSVNGRAGQNGFGGGFGADESCVLTISGGRIYVDAAGDGLDSNGSIVMTGGDVFVDGPTDNGNGALDYGSEFTKSGGNLVAAGSGGMLQTISTSSSNYCLSVGFSSNQTGGNTISVTDSDGNELLSYSPTKDFAAVVISLEEFEEGAEYTVNVNGSEYGSAEMSSIVTNIGTAFSGMGGGMGGGSKPNRGARDF